MDDKLIKTKRIKLDKIKNQIDEVALKIYLERFKGIQAAEYNKKEDVIIVKYELEKTNFEGIEKLLINLKIELSNNWNDRLKRGMVKFTEKNELDNLAIKPHSCCEDPKEACQR